MSKPQVVILAAGMGTRLGMSSPKPLTALADGQTIMQRQLGHLEVALPQAQVMVVVGHKPDLIMRAAPHVLFAYNHRFDRTNTSKSLLLALRLSLPGGVLWLNGDVVFQHGLLERIEPKIEADESFVCVNTAAVADEEVAYTVDRDGYILRLSKALIGGLGEAVGINYVASSDKETLIEHLESCADQDYFERGIESAIETAGMRVLALGISEFAVVEVDFPVDLERANAEVCRIPARPLASQTELGLGERYRR